jgi:arylsulfatase A-like enzyme/thioredoxin-like negative regulator of GroEL
VVRSFRFTIILLLAALGTILAALGGWRFARASAPVNGPIILISIDTLRADHLPAYGYTRVKTPAIDALAADGLLFERAYAHAPQTLPAHASLLSGRLPFETGVRDDISVVKPSERLLPQMLGERGFATGGVVSTYLLRKETGINQGFDFFDGEMPAAPADRSIGHLKRDGAESEAVAERWLDQQRSQRVFLFLHLFEPHRPYAPPAQYAEYDPYDGEIAYADDIVGRLIRHLKAQQLYDRSTIILLSDHGEGLGDHGEAEHGLFLYDEALHVPLIIKQAGGAGAGRRIPDVVQHADLAPTILDLAKAPIPGNLHGRSLAPILDGTGTLPEQAVYSEAWYARTHFGWSELTALTTPRLRYVRAPEEELYDLGRDPHERDNIATSEASERQTLRTALDAVNTVPPREPAVDPKDKREVVEQFRKAEELSDGEHWDQAIVLLDGIVRAEPELIEVWQELARVAMRIDRFGTAVEAYNHLADLIPSDPSPLLGAASALLKLNKLDEARLEGQAAAERVPDGTTQATAHELLARIALARHDAEEARHEAELVAQADPNLPAAAFVEARLLYDRGKFSEALPLFEQVLAALSKYAPATIEDVHFYVADTLSRLERLSEAEFEFEEQLRADPHHARANAGLATVYAKTGRTDEAEQTATDMIRISPTPEAYALAAKIWTTLGNPTRAEALRLEARKTFGKPK